MRKIINFLILVVIVIGNIYAFDFIHIPGDSLIIGSNEFKYIENLFNDREEMELLAGKWIYPYKEHDAEISDFYISKNEITNKDFLTFLDAVKKKTRYELENQLTEVYRTNIKNNEWLHPVKMISVFEILAYCQWLSDKTGETIRLPTSAEWEYAAMGKEKKKFPWGEHQQILESLGTNKIIYPDGFPIGQVPENISPFGLMGVYGGSEAVLDLFDYEKLNPQFEKVNPLFFQCEVVGFVGRSSNRYNDLNDKTGLFKKVDMGFDLYFENTFRIVKEIETVFNKGSTVECTFFQSQGFFKKETKVYFSPDYVDENTLTNKAMNEKCLILFKQEKEGSTWYKIYYPGQGKFGIYWFTGWVEADKIQITTDKWYGKMWDWYMSFALD